MRHGIALVSDSATGPLLPSHKVTKPPLHFWLGAGALLISHVLVFLRVEPLYTYFFSFAWWPYILWIDGWVYWRTGQSLLITHPRAFVAAAFWSIACWCLYEAFNFRLQNWYYVMTPDPAWAYRLNYAVGFATVFPGLFETAALLSSFGLFQHWRTPSFVVTPRVLRPVFVSGLLATVLPAGVAPALLSAHLDEYGVAVGAAGVSVAGTESAGGTRAWRTTSDWPLSSPRERSTEGLWEGWNVLTRTGWIYTVPWLDWFHVFEMPLAGYLGFPLLAIECAVLWSVLDLYHLTGAAPVARRCSVSVSAPPHVRLRGSRARLDSARLCWHPSLDVVLTPCDTGRTPWHHCARGCCVRSSRTALPLRPAARGAPAWTCQCRHRVTTSLRAVARVA